MGLHHGYTYICKKTLLSRGDKYVREIVKLLPEKPDPVLLANIFARICSLGRIHKDSASTASA